MGVKGGRFKEEKTTYEQVTGTTESQGREVKEEGSDGVKKEAEK